MCAPRATEDKMDRESEDKMKKNPAGREQTESDKKNELGLSFSPVSLHMCVCPNIDLFNYLTKDILLIQALECITI